MTRLLVNVAGFYVGWFACVLAAAHGRPLLGAAAMVPILAIHFALHPARRREAALLLGVTMLGTLVDTGMLLAGVLRFEASSTVTPVFLVWIAALWANFATTLHGCLRWLARRPAWAMLLGALGGPATFYAGVQMGAIGMHDSPWISLAAWAVEWGVLIPALLVLAHHWHSSTPAALPNGVNP